MKYLSDIFKLVDNEILEHSQAVNVFVYPEKRAMEVVAKCVRMVRAESCRKLAQQVISAYKLNDFSLEFVYDREIFNVNSIKTVAGYVSEYPQLVPILDNAELKLEDNVLSVDCLGGGIVDEEAKAMLVESVKKMFDLDIEIKFIQTKTEEEIEEKFELEKIQTRE